MSLEETATPLETRILGLRDAMIRYFNDKHTSFNPQGTLYSARGTTTYPNGLITTVEVTRHYREAEEQQRITGNEWGVIIRGRGHLTKKVTFGESKNHPGRIRMIVNDGLQEKASGSQDEARRILELDQQIITYLEQIATFDEQHLAKDGMPQLRFLEGTKQGLLFNNLYF